MIRSLFLFIAIFALQDFIAAQRGLLLYTERRPNYTQYKEEYKLRKVKYYENRIVLHVELQLKATSSTWGGRTVVFLPPGADDCWVLRDVETGEVFDLKEVRNITRNGKKVKSRLRTIKDIYQVSLDPLDKRPELFTCEVHFDRLPDHIRQVNLLEGASNQESEGHWNFLEIKLKELTESLIADAHSADSLAIANNTNSNPDKEKKDSKKSASGIPKVESSGDIKCGQMLELSNIRFEDNATRFHNSTLTERTLYSLLHYLESNTSSKITLYGHTDIFGDAERNMELSKQRVEKLGSWLQQRGIAANRITCEFFGGTKPTNKGGGAVNRRVEMMVTCEK